YGTPYGRLFICSVGVTLCWWYCVRGETLSAPFKSKHDSGCNNPTCLRCHGSSSSRHIKSFRDNVTTLRRLVKLEPELFKGMRQEIWSAIDIMENTFGQKHDMNIMGTLKRWVQQFWVIRQKVHSEATTSYPTMLLSPQEGQNPTVFFLRGLEAIPLHDANQCVAGCPCSRLWKSSPISKKAAPIPVTGDIEALKTNYDVIRQELLDFISNQQSSLEFKSFDPGVFTSASTHSNETLFTSAKEAETNPEWSSIYLYHQGIRQPRSCNEFFPKTTHILEAKCPHLIAGKSGLGSIYFSRLKRNTKVNEHCGPTNIRWRCHLPLVVPKCKKSAEKSCLLVGAPGINETSVEWHEGVPLLFDDSFLHSAVHYDSDSDFDGARIVLIVDFWHPSLSESDQIALGVLYPPGS
ncbi:hypothetical protein ACHAWF_003979, partial [Thalassiosira exigua]